MLPAKWKAQNGRNADQNKDLDTLNIDDSIGYFVYAVKLFYSS
jgi:hypothetical protein